MKNLLALAADEPYNADYSLAKAVEAKELISGIMERLDRLIFVCEDLGIQCLELDEVRDFLTRGTSRLFESILDEISRHELFYDE